MYCKVLYYTYVLHYSMYIYVQYIIIHNKEKEIYKEKEIRKRNNKKFKY